MANFSINQFQTEVRTRNLARPNRFEIVFPLPKGMTDSSVLGDSRLVSLFCESTSLPTQSIGVKQQRIYGPSYQRPFSSEFGGEGITMTFLVDGSMDVKGFFDAWLSIIVDPFQYFVHYSDNYTVPIIIKQLNEQDKPIYSVTLEEAFPRNIAIMELNNTLQNSVHKLNVTFAYRRWFPYHRIPNAIDYPEVWQKSTTSPSNPFQTTNIDIEPESSQRMSSSIETYRYITRDPAVDNSDEKKRMRSALDTYNSLFER
jgi:hypothetical protein